MSPEALREQHKRGMAIRGYAALAEELFAEVERLIAERDRYKQHSITLNTIGWKVTEALGDIPPGADAIVGDPVVQVERLIREHGSLARRCSVRFGETQEAKAELAQAMDELGQVKKLAGGYARDTQLLRAEASRARPVLDAALAWRHWFPSADSMFVPENALIAAVDGWLADTKPGEGVPSAADWRENSSEWHKPHAFNPYPNDTQCQECFGYESDPLHAVAEGLSSTDTTEANR